MTDEEKVNNYELACIADVYKDDVCTIPYAYSAQKLEQAYLDGLAEGRKEVYEELNWVTDTDNYIASKLERLRYLEKENKISEEIIIGEQQEINELKKDNAELKKHLEQWEQEWQDAQIKANEEGYARTTLQIKHKELEKENAELQERIREVENDSNNCEHWSYERIKELELQIEKMKNVGNCKKAMICAEWNEKQCILGQMRFCLNCDKWEMAE